MQPPAGSGDRQPGREWATYTTLRKRWPVEDAKAHADEMMASFPGADSRPKYPVSRYRADS